MLPAVWNAQLVVLQRKAKMTISWAVTHKSAWCSSFQIETVIWGKEYTFCGRWLHISFGYFKQCEFHHGFMRMRLHYFFHCLQTQMLVWKNKRSQSWTNYPQHSKQWGREWYYVTCVCLWETETLSWIWYAKNCECQNNITHKLPYINFYSNSVSLM